MDDLSRSFRLDGVHSPGFPRNIPKNNTPMTNLKLSTVKNNQSLDNLIFNLVKTKTKLDQTNKNGVSSQSIVNHRILNLQKLSIKLVPEIPTISLNHTSSKIVENGQADLLCSHLSPTNSNGVQHQTIGSKTRKPSLPLRLILVQKEPVQPVETIKQLDDLIGINRKKLVLNLNQNFLSSSSTQNGTLASKQSDLSGKKPHLSGFVPKKRLRIRLVKNIDHTWSTTKIIQDQCPRGWENLFSKVLNQLPSIDQELEKYRRKGLLIFPYRQEIFKVYDVCRPENIKVVILGQDPYHSLDNGKPRANGIAFSTRRGNPIPPSLRNIYKEISHCIPNFNFPTHGDLTKWVSQGVFLINSCLTVSKGEPGGHGDLWANVIKETLLEITIKNPNVIFILWGNKAQTLYRRTIKKLFTTFESAHPSPMSASRGFYGCQHFLLVNKRLKELGLTEIDWNVD